MTSIIVAIILDELFLMNGWIDWLKKIGIFSFVPTLCLIILDKYIWKIPFINCCLFQLPNLNGDWKGYYSRQNDEGHHSLTLKITQTLSNIHIRSISKNSEGKSISIDLIRNEFNEVKLVYVWESKHNSLIHHEIKEHMYGLSILGLIDNNTLSGDYFTNRTPQTKGKSVFKRERI